MNADNSKTIKDGEFIKYRELEIKDRELASKVENWDLDISGTIMIENWDFTFRFHSLVGISDSDWD